MNHHPIGVFDSGVGGLSVFKEIQKALPNESMVYLADTSNCPYGTKSRDQARALSKKSIRFLVDRGCKLIVIACNTVTAVAIDHFRRTLPLSFIGMEPAIKPAVLETRSKVVGILATENTLKGDLFLKTCDHYAKGIKVIARAGNGLVEQVENNELDSDETKRLLNGYLTPMMENGADTLVLGCTHYPFLRPAIDRVTQNRLTIIDPAKAVAAQTARVLNSSGLRAARSDHCRYQFYTTQKTKANQSFLSRVMEGSYALTQVNL